MGGVVFTIQDANIEDFFDSPSETVTPSSTQNTKTETDVNITTRGTNNIQTSPPYHQNPTSGAKLGAYVDNGESAVFFRPFETYESFVDQFYRELKGLFRHLKDMPPSYYNKMIANGDYPFANNGKLNQQKRHNHPQNKASINYNLSMIQLLCKIIVFDYIGPIAYKSKFQSFHYKRSFKQRKYVGDPQKLEMYLASPKDFRNVEHKLTYKFRVNCGLHCPNIIYNNRNGNCLCENVFGIMLFDQLVSLSSPMFVEITPKDNVMDTDDNSVQKRKKMKILTFDYMNRNCYRSPKRLSILPLQFSDIIDDYRTAQRSIILETFNSNDGDVSINGGNNSNYRPIQFIFLLGMERFGALIQCRLLPIISNPNQFNPFFDFDEQGRLGMIEIENIQDYPMLKHLNQFGQIKHSSPKQEKKGKNFKKKRDKRLEIEKSMAYSFVNIQFRHTLRLLCQNIEEVDKWADELLFSHKPSTVLFKQGKFGLEFEKNVNINEKNRGYFVWLSKKGIIMYQLNVFVDIDGKNFSVKNLTYENFCNFLQKELLICSSLPHGKMLGDGYGRQISKDELIKYLDKINDKNSDHKYPLKHQIMQNYFYFSHFYDIGETIYGETPLTMTSGMDAAFDAQRKILFSCVKFKGYHLKILIFNNNYNCNSLNINNINITTANNNSINSIKNNIIAIDESDDHNDTRDNEKKILVKPIETNDKKNNGNYKNDDNSDNNKVGSTNITSRKKKRRHRGRRHSSRKKDRNDSQNSQLSHLSHLNAHVDACEKLIIFDCPLAENEDYKDYEQDEQLLLMFYSCDNDRVYILMHQLFEIELSEEIDSDQDGGINTNTKHEYKLYLRLIELNGQVVNEMFNIHGIHLKFEQLINNNGIIIYQAKEILKDLDWTSNRGYNRKPSSIAHARHIFDKWFYNDNDNCIVGFCQNRFVMIPLNQLMLK